VVQVFSPAPSPNAFILSGLRESHLDNVAAENAKARHQRENHRVLDRRIHLTRAGPILSVDTRLGKRKIMRKQGVPTLA
jgi:hypothetical protein